MIEELNESSANFDPQLNQDMLQLLSLPKSSKVSRSRKKDVEITLVTYELDEFEQALS